MPVLRISSAAAVLMRMLLLVELVSHTMIRSADAGSHFRVNDETNAIEFSVVEGGRGSPGHTSTGNLPPPTHSGSAFGSHAQTNTPPLVDHPKPYYPDPHPPPINRAAHHPPTSNNNPGFPNPLKDQLEGASVWDPLRPQGQPAPPTYPPPAHLLGIHDKMKHPVVGRYGQGPMVSPQQINLLDQ
eukprot:920973-Prorocentrum_minimum.AAC.1